MSQTTIIISNLDKSNFVASAGHKLSLANQIKNALVEPSLYSHEPTQKVISHWSELPFLNRVIAIFEEDQDAALAFELLSKIHRKTAKNPPFELPDSARIFLQENLLQRSKSSDVLTEKHAMKIEKAIQAGEMDSGDLAGYHEPKPKPLDMYTDLLNAGIDISKFNTEEEVKEVRGSGNLPLGRARSVTKTLFKPSLSIDTSATHSGGAAPASPTITLDQS